VCRLVPRSSCGWGSALCRRLLLWGLKQGFSFGVDDEVEDEICLLDLWRGVDRDDAVSVVFCLEVAGTENAVLNVRERVSGLKCGVLGLCGHFLFLDRLVRA
jgi:hypothetical protein